MVRLSGGELPMFSFNFLKRYRTVTHSCCLLWCVNTGGVSFVFVVSCLSDVTDMLNSYFLIV